VKASETDLSNLPSHIVIGILGTLCVHFSCSALLFALSIDMSISMRKTKELSRNQDLFRLQR
jgi:hypothetical protein